MSADSWLEYVVALHDTYRSSPCSHLMLPSVQHGCDNRAREWWLYQQKFCLASRLANQDRFKFYYNVLINKKKRFYALQFRERTLPVCRACMDFQSMVSMVVIVDTKPHF
jgi:hypothetical protein